jgi:hypothetical protein
MIAFNLAIISIIIVKFLVRRKAIIINGASFCHVDKINAAIHEIDIITDGYHI